MANLGDEFFGIRKTFFGAQIEEQIESHPLIVHIAGKIEEVRFYGGRRVRFSGIYCRSENRC